MKLNFVEPAPSEVPAVRALVPRGKVTTADIATYESARPQVQALAHAELIGRAEAPGPGPSIAFLTVGIGLLAAFAYYVLDKALKIISDGGATDTAAGQEFLNNSLRSYAIFLVIVIAAFAGLFIWKAVSEYRSVRAKSRLDAYESGSGTVISPPNVGVADPAAVAAP